MALAITNHSHGCRLLFPFKKENTSKGPFPGSSTEPCLAYWECFCTWNSLFLNSRKTENRIGSSRLSFFVSFDIEWEKAVKGMWSAAALPFDLWRSETDHEKQTVLDLMLCLRKASSQKWSLELCLVFVTKHMNFLPLPPHHWFLTLFDFSIFLFLFNAAKSGSLNKELWFWSNKEEKKKREERERERKRESCLDSHASSEINEGEAKESCAWKSNVITIYAEMHLCLHMYVLSHFVF